MHEFHYAKDIAEEIRRRTDALKAVKAVEVQLGALLRFDPAMCAEMLKQLLKDSPAGSAEFAVALTPALAQCADCGKEFEPDPNIVHCPGCGSFEVEIISGEGWQITAIK
jgi:hydrogenase nickel incorporation protein HypA/HybF